MLAWLAPALAAATAPELNPLLVAAYAAVHDAAEVFAGDTPTLRISDGERQAKALREQKAVLRWRDELGGTLPWLPDSITEYETQAAAEARFVRALDKVCPKFLHVINGGQDLLDYGMGSAELAGNLRRQREDIGSYAAEFSGLLALYDEMAERAIGVLRDAEAAGS
jgi:5'-deoxynucleotidase YfbR-like HD superfamily hydrolase